jgi:hypothetical protein
MKKIIVILIAFLSIFVQLQAQNNLGKTFRSGRLNIPVNAYVRPNYKSGSQFGISFGFNARSYSQS